MNPTIVLVIAVGVLFACGVTLLLERTLTRVILGVTLLGNGTNLLILLGGGYGGPPIVGVTPESRMSDPLAQAMILTAIVITLGMTALLLALAYRSWVLTGHDEVQDDIEDRRIMERAERDQGLETQDDTDTRGFTDDADTADGVAEALDERPAHRGAAEARITHDGGTPR